MLPRRLLLAGLLALLGATSAAQTQIRIRGVIVSQVLPAEHSLATPMVREAADLARGANSPEITPALLDGFAAACSARLKPSTAMTWAGWN